MDKLEQEYIELLSGEGNASNKGIYSGVALFVTEC